MNRIIFIEEIKIPKIEIKIDDLLDLRDKFFFTEDFYENTGILSLKNERVFTTENSHLNKFMAEESVPFFKLSDRAREEMTIPINLFLPKFYFLFLNNKLEKKEKNIFKSLNTKQEKIFVWAEYIKDKKIFVCDSFPYSKHDSLDFGSFIFSKKLVSRA